MSIVWRDKVLSSYNGNIESVMIYDTEGTATQAVTNGVFVTLDGLEGIGREVKKAKLTGADEEGTILLVDSPEVNYEAGKDLADFINDKDDVARAFRLADGDVITLTDDLITGGKPEVGAVLVAGANGKLVEGLAGEGIHFVVRELADNELARGVKATRLDVIGK